MWQGKTKAITFSFDDGVTQDIRLVEILNKYGLKGTFNLNSAKLGLPGDVWKVDGREIPRSMINASQVAELYKGHEVAVHTLTHPNLTTLNDETVIWQVDEDRKALSGLCGYPVIGMAYPCGGVNNDERVAKLIKDNTPIAYARTITSTHSYDLQKGNLLRFNPTLHFLDTKLDEVVDKFLTMETDEPQLLYIWGHSYELDYDESRWIRFEELCQKLSGRGDIFYGTNKECLL
ncbi:MAG: polysaccharide deacetylase family protein [Clostridia bacterium]|nr:polysaccharide deacetylase family protein [Clostridia bacterium]